MDYAAVEDLFTLARSEVEESFDADSVDGIIPPHSVIEATSAELAKMAKGARAAEVTKACSTLATLAGALSGSNFSASMKARFSHGIASRARGIVDAATAAGSASDPIDAKRAAERFAQLCDSIKRAAEEKDVCAVLLDEVTADADLIAQIDALQAKIDARDHSNVAEAEANHAALSALMEQRVDVFEGKAAALRKAKYPDGAPFAALVCEDAPIAVAVAQDAADATSALGRVRRDIKAIKAHAKSVKRRIAAEGKVQARHAKTAAQQKASALAMLKKALAAEKLAKASELKISAMRAHADAVESCCDDLEQAKSVCETNQHLAKEVETVVLCSIDAVKGAYAERLEVVQSKASEFDRDLVSMHKSLWGNYVKSRVHMVRNAQEWTEKAAQFKRDEDLLVRQQNFDKAQLKETQRKEFETLSAGALSEAAALERKARKIDVRAAPSYLKLADEVEHPYFRVQSEVIKEHEDISLLQIRNALLENPVVSGVALLTPEAKKTLRLVDSPESVSDIARCLFADGDAAPALPKCDLLALATQRTCSVVVPDSLVIPQPVTRAEVMLWMSADAALEAAVEAARAAEARAVEAVCVAGPDNSFTKFDATKYAVSEGGKRVTRRGGGWSPAIAGTVLEPNSGVHVWGVEVLVTIAHWNIMFGVCAENASETTKRLFGSAAAASIYGCGGGCRGSLGTTTGSSGWHDGVNVTAGDTITLTLDTTAGTLTFAKNGHLAQASFSNLQGKRVRPFISMGGKDDSVRFS